MIEPTPEKIKATRIASGLTQAEAAKLIFGAMRSWQDYEAGKRKMHPAIFAFFLLRTNQIQLCDFD